MKLALKVDVDTLDGTRTGVPERLRLFDLACARFREIFGRPAVVLGAAGWQMNAHAYRAEAELGFRYASDARGRSPYQPVIDGKPAGCVQLPTTLPTLDELIGRGDLPEA